MIFANLQKVKENINSTLRKIGDPDRDVKLIVVTKTHSPEVIDEAIASGAEFIGENKVQEAELKLSKLQNSYKEFHFIGHLQSNKINKLLKLNPSLIHSLDKLSTAEKLNEVTSKMGKTQQVLVQINTSEEVSKSGASKDYAYNLVKSISELSNLQVVGLMTIGSLDANPECTKKCFEYLKKLFEECKEISTAKMQWLSMGMSGDYQLALECGANMLRVGSSVFGQRNYN